MEEVDSEVLLKLLVIFVVIDKILDLARFALKQKIKSLKRKKQCGILDHGQSPL